MVSRIDIDVKGESENRICDKECYGSENSDKKKCFPENAVLHIEDEGEPVPRGECEQYECHWPENDSRSKAELMKECCRDKEYKG